MADDELRADELIALVRRVFQPRDQDRALAVLVDLPDDEVPDTERWQQRRRIAAGWARELAASRAEHGFDIALLLYRNVHSNNADLPASCWRWTADEVPDHVREMTGHLEEPLQDLLASHQLVLAPTQFSTTAPLKMLAPRLGCRAATMPGFSPAMVPALRLDYTEVNRRVQLCKGLLDDAVVARFRFVVDGRDTYELDLDLRHRTAHASGGLLPEPGTAGNLPSGEAYIVPYEGELDGDPTATAGTLPVQLDDEVVLFTVESNVATGVESIGARSEAERRLLAEEPARGNLAELGLGVLADFGLEPIGEVLLDEKLGLHLAFGRSEHFGGQVGPDRFSRPSAVIHQDHVYLPQLQPRIEVLQAVLRMPDGSHNVIMENGRYRIDFEAS